VKYVVLIVGIFFCLATLARGDEFILKCKQDAEVDQEEPNVNKGGGQDIQVGGTWGEPLVTQAKGLFEFESLPMTFPEYTIVVDSAVLRLHMVGNDLGEAPIEFFTVAEGWKEMSVTWNTRPAENRDIVVTDIPPPLEPPTQLWEIDVTEIVQTWYGYNPIEAYGFYIDVPDNGIPVDIDIASRENPDSLLHPVLWVDSHTEGVDEAEPEEAAQLTLTRLSSGEVTIDYILPSSLSASLKIYDASGSLCKPWSTARFSQETTNSHGALRTQVSISSSWR
jgi:hypothetical protein